MPLDKRKKLKALTPLPHLLTQCYKLTSLYKKEKKRNMQFSLNIHLYYYSKLFSKNDIFYTISFSQSWIIKNYKSHNVKLIDFPSHFVFQMI